MQLRERLIQTVGDGLTLTFIYIGGETDRADSNHNRGGSHTPVEVDVIRLTTGGNEMSERQEATQAGHYRQEDERERHRPRCLMRSVMLMSLFVFRTPEDTVVQTEHIEGCHGGNTCHDPTADGTVVHTCRQDLVLREESRERRNACDGKTGDQESDVGNRHILTQATHHRHLITMYGMDDTTSTQEQTCLEHGMSEQVEHTCHET